MIRRGERVLVARRPAHKRHGGLWEFPGGKLEPGESWLDAACRELAEELDVRVASAGMPRHVERDPESQYSIVFVEVEIEGEPRPLEHEELRWVSASEAGAMALAPADRRYVEFIAHDDADVDRLA